MPQASTCSGSRATWFSSRGRHSPKACSRNSQGPGRVSSRLKSAPKPGMEIPRPHPSALRRALEPVAAHEIGGWLGNVGETRNVDAVGTPAARGAILPAVKDGRRVIAHGVVHQILAQHAARVGQAVGEVGRRRVEQDACRFQGRSPEEDGAGVELKFFVALAVDDAHAGHPPPLRIPDDAGHHAVGPEGQAAGGFRRGQGRVDGAEVAAGAAAAVAGTAVVAGSAALVIACEHRGTADGHAPGSAERALDRVAHVLLDARHRHRRQENSVRNLRQPLGLSADADEGLHVVVPGGDVGVADGPVDAVAVAGVGLEVEVAQPVALARPHDRAAPHLAPADPEEGLLRVAGVRDARCR